MLNISWNLSAWFEQQKFRNVGALFLFGGCQGFGDSVLQTFLVIGNFCCIISGLQSVQLRIWAESSSL